MKNGKQVDDGIGRIVGAMFGTLVVADEGWAESIPDWMKNLAQLERLAQAIEKDTTMCTDAEALCYLYTMSLARPMTDEGNRIYLWLSNRYIKQKFGTSPMNVPATLSKSDEQAYIRLKEFIFQARQKREGERFKASKQKAKAAGVK